MIKQWTILVFVCLLFVSMLSGDYSTSIDFLATAEDVGAGSTATRGTHFSSRPINVKITNSCAITITFTRAAGSSSEVDFEFVASYDGGVTYTTTYMFKISVTTDSVATDNVVRDLRLINLNGVSHLRLNIIRNNDVSNALTNCNARLSR